MNKFQIPYRVHKEQIIYTTVLRHLHHKCKCRFFVVIIDTQICYTLSSSLLSQTRTSNNIYSVSTLHYMCQRCMQVSVNSYNLFVLHYPPFNKDMSHVSCELAFGDCFAVDIFVVHYLLLLSCCWAAS